MQMNAQADGRRVETTDWANLLGWNASCHEKRRANLIRAQLLKSATQNLLLHPIAR